MLMKRLTPEDAWKAFQDNREVFELKPINPARTFVTELLENENLVVFEETPEAKPEDPEPEPAKKRGRPAKKKEVDDAQIIELHNAGYTVGGIASTTGADPKHIAEVIQAHYDKELKKD